MVIQRLGLEKYMMNMEGLCVRKVRKSSKKGGMSKDIRVSSEGLPLVQSEIIRASK